MNENVVPKWQRELRSFLGIKSGIILEGNVYDEFPIFQYEGSDIIFSDINNLDQTILSMVHDEKTDIFFFDPVDGFYCYEKSEEAQVKKLQPLLDGYETCEIKKDHDTTICLMPSGKKKSGKGNSDSEQYKYVWVSEIIRQAISDKEQYTKKDNLFFVLNFASRLDACNLQEAEANMMFLNLMAATTSFQTSQSVRNSLIMVVDKYNDIPAWMYLNNPNIRTISICTPDRNTRRLYLENLFGDLVPYQLLSDDNYEPGKQFVAETEGLQLQELHQILRLAFNKDIKPESINLAFRLYKYGVLDNPWENLEKDILVDVCNNLKTRVKGQDAAIEKVVTVVARAIKGLSGLQHSGASHKPKGILFFAGPTGVGKTETAKALAESLFGDENACIRFDMSEYRLEQSEQKLFGAPPGYVGYEGGGQLTNAVKNRPFSVLLFDEIEKAHPTILDKFLQILEDGRMTDNQGNTVYFGETIIIFTSNIGLTKESSEPENVFRSTPHRVPTITIENPEEEDTEEFRHRVTEMLTEGVESYFSDIGRPELLNRLGSDNIVVFQFINKPDAIAICEYKLDKICKTIETEKNIHVLTEGVRQMLCQKAISERVNGGRGIGNMLEREFLNPLGKAICELSDKPSVLRSYVSNDHIEFEVMLNED